MNMIKDDQHLVGDKGDSKFYGSVHGGATSAYESAHSTGAAPIIGPSLSYLNRKLEVKFNIDFVWTLVFFSG